MRLLKESVLQIWKARKAAVREEIANAERAAKSIQDKLDRLDEAFLFERAIDIETYDRHAEKLREELTLLRIDRHSGQLEELDAEGILAFAERVLPRAADLWVQASLEQRQRFQQLFFPEGLAFDGNRFVRTGATAPAFSYLRGIETENEGLVGLSRLEPLAAEDRSRAAQLLPTTRGRSVRPLRLRESIRKSGLAPTSITRRKRSSASSSGQVSNSGVTTCGAPRPASWSAPACRGSSCRRS